MTDEERQQLFDLIKQAKEGKQSAFTKLYEKYNRIIYSTIYRIVNNKDAADDLLSVTFTKAFSKLDSYINNISFEMWLKTIAINTAIDFIRKSRNEKNDYVDDDTCLYEFTDNFFGTPESNTINKQEIAYLFEKLIPSMRYKDRELIRLKYIENLSYREIASSLKIQEDAVKSTLAKAKKRLILKYDKYNKQLSENNNGKCINSTSASSSNHHDSLKGFQIDGTVS